METYDEDGVCDVYDDAFLEAFDEEEIEIIASSSEELSHDDSANMASSMDSEQEECAVEKSTNESTPICWEKALTTFMWSPQLKASLAPHVSKNPLNMKSREGDEAVRKLTEAGSADLTRFSLSLLNNSSLEETENKLGAYYAYLEKDRRRNQIGYPSKRSQLRANAASKRPHLQNPNLIMKTNFASWVHRQPTLEEPLEQFYASEAAAANDKLRKKHRPFSLRHSPFQTADRGRDQQVDSRLVDGRNNVPYPPTQKERRGVRSSIGMESKEAHAAAAEKHRKRMERNSSRRESKEVSAAAAAGEKQGEAADNDRHTGTKEKKSRRLSTTHCVNVDV